MHHPNFPRRIIYKNYCAGDFLFLQQLKKTHLRSVHGGCPKKCKILFFSFKIFA